MSPTAASRSTANPWAKVFRPRPEAPLRMFCFPYAGGGASVYRLWPDALPSSVELVAVQLPGREARWRDAARTHIDVLVREITDGLEPLLDRPYVFFGHSMGGALAFETIRRLRAAGSPLPRHLYVSGRPGPRVQEKEDPIHELPKAEFIEAIRGYAGTPEEVLQNDELMELVEPLLRADFAVCETYHYQPTEPLTLPITAFGGTGDEDVPEADLEAWRQETTGPFEMHMIDGGHFFLNEKRDELLRLLSRSLSLHLTGLASAGARP